MLSRKESGNLSVAAKVEDQVYLRIKTKTLDFALKLRYVSSTTCCIGGSGILGVTSWRDIANIVEWFNKNTQWIVSVIISTIQVCSVERLIHILLNACVHFTKKKIIIIDNHLW